MSKKVCAGKPLVVPTESEETLINRLKYEGKFLKASIWLHNLIIHRIEDVDVVAVHYTTGDFAFREDEESISKLFGQKDGIFCRRFAYYCEMIKKYEQGNIPDGRLADDFRLTNILLSRLSKLAEDKTSVRHADRLVTSFHELISGAHPRLDDSADYHKKIDEFQDKICAAFAHVSDAFYAQEHAKKPRAEIQPATKKDVAEIVRQETAPIKKTLAKVDETTTTINNRDKKYRRKSKARFTVEQQDGIYRQWTIAKKDPCVKSLAKHKPGYEVAIIQFKKEFVALGVSSANELKRALKSRIARMVELFSF